MNHRRCLLFPAMAMAGVLLAACGGGGGGSGEGGGGDSATGEGMEDGVVVRMDGESREEYLTRLYEAAQEEGTVAYYTAANESETEVIAENWNEMYPGIELQPVSASSGTLLERALVEAETGKIQGDVFHASSADVAVLDEAGAWSDYVPVNAEDVAEEYKAEGEPVPASYLTYHPAYNTEMVGEEDLPADWMGYCDPEWKGKLALDQEAADWTAGILAGMGEEDGMAFLECLAANEPRLVRGTSNRTELLATGEYPVMLDGYGHSLLEFEEEGAPIKAQRPSPSPLPALPQFEMVFEEAPHPNAARLLSEFFLTPEGQEAWLNRNKAGVLADGDQEANAGLVEGAEVVYLNPGDTDFPAAYDIFNELFLG